MKNSNESPDVFGNDKGKGNNRLPQLKIIFVAFFKSPKTMRMVAVETGIDRGSVCWHVGELLENRSIQLVKTGKCPISKHSKVGFYTTDPGKMSQPLQLNIFRSAKS